VIDLHCEHDQNSRKRKNQIKKKSEPSSIKTNSSNNKYDNSKDYQEYEKEKWKNNLILTIDFQLYPIKKNEKYLKGQKSKDIKARKDLFRKYCS
jgi:hypothetical protein